MQMPKRETGEKRNTKDAILEAAIDLFSERGFSAVSVRDITGRAGVNESTLYIHFENKDDLLNVIIELFRREFGRAFAIDEGELAKRLAGATPEAFLHHHVMGLRDRLTPRVMQIWRIIYMELFRNRLVRGFFLDEALRASVRFYEKAFSLMMDQGMIRRGDAKALAEEFNAALSALQMESMLLQADGDDAAQTAAKIFAHIRFFCEALSPHPERN